MHRFSILALAAILMMVVGCSDDDTTTPTEDGGTGDVGATDGGDSGGAMVTTTSNKRQNCARCFGTVKADKGSACPGCSQLYCWRCEKKAFAVCPNGSECVHPIRICKLCADGNTVIYCSRTIAKFLHKQAMNKSNVQLTLSESANGGQPVVSFLGHPIRRMDAILETEAQVT